MDFNITDQGEYARAMIEAQPGSGAWEELTDLIHKNRWPVKEFVREKASLEEAFRHYVKTGVARTKEKAA